MDYSGVKSIAFRRFLGKKVSPVVQSTDMVLCMIQHECRDLKERYKSDFTMQILKTVEHLDSACVLTEAE